MRPFRRHDRTVSILATQRDGAMKQLSVAAADARVTSNLSASETKAMDRTLMRGLAWTGAVKWLSQVLSWLSTIVVARLLVPEDYGLVAMAMAVLGLITLFNEFGLGAAVVALRHLSDEQIAQIHSLASLFGVSGFLLTCALAIPTGRYFGASEVPLIMIAMSAGFVFLAMRSVPSAVLEKELRFKFLAFLEGGQSLLATVTTVILAWNGAGYWALVLGGLAGQAGATSVIWISRPLRYAWPSLHSLKEAIRFSSHVLVSRISWYVSSNSDVFIAGRILGQAMVGTYSFAGTLASVPQEKVTALLSRVMPAFYSTVQHDVQAMRRYLLILTEGLALIAFPIAVGMSLVAQDFVLLVLGEKWMAVVAPLQIMAAWAALRSVFSLVPPLLYVTGASRVVMLNSLFCVATYPPAFWIGSHWGTIGLATAWVLVQPPSWIAPYRHVMKALGMSIREYLAALWPGISGVSVMAISIVGTHWLYLKESIPSVRLGVDAMLGAAVYTMILMIFHRQRIRSFLALARMGRE